jgi:hypothetical protein
MTMRLLRICVRGLAKPVTIGLTLAVGLFTACGMRQDESRPVVRGLDLEAFNRHFTVIDSLSLQEVGSVVTVNPILTPDSRGGFFVVEEAEEQVRVYSERGQLEKVLGEGTGRADSLRAPTGADRLESGDIIATSLLTSNLTIVPADSGKPVWQMRTPLRLLEGVLVLDDERVLLTGPDLPYPQALLHIFNLSSDSMIKSFFPPPAQVDSNVALVLGRVHVALRGNRVAAVHSLSDTVFLFDRLGTLQSSVRIPIDSFNVPERLPDIEALPERRAWIDSRLLLWDVFWDGDDALIVQTVRGRRSNAEYSIVRMDALGRQSWAIHRSPRLLTVRDSLFYFQDPGTSLPNRLIVAVRARGQ